MRTSRVLPGLLLAAVVPFLTTDTTFCPDPPAQQSPWLAAARARLAAKAAGTGDLTEPTTSPAEAGRFFMRQRLAAGEKELPMEHLRAMLDDIEAREATQRSALPAGIQGWQSIGPGNIGGRTRSILIDPTNPSILFAGGVSGGVFKSTDAGASWTPTDDLMLNLAIGSMVMDPTDPSTIYAGTGEGFGAGVFVRGLGVFKTTDAGGTWTQLPQTAGAEFYYVNELAISPNDPNTVYAATRYGVIRSTDAGATWAMLLSNPSYIGTTPATNGCTLGCLDIAVRQDTSPDVIFAAFGGFQKDGLFRSDDGGVTWTEYVTPSYQGRMEIAVAPSDNDRIYVGMADNGGLAQLGRLADLWRADDGLNFSSVVDLGHKFGPWLFSYVSIATGCITGYPIYSQGWYDQVLAVDPVDKDILYVGGVNIYRSDDAGVTFGMMGSWLFPRTPPEHPQYMHPDQHTFVFHPQFDGVTNQTMLVGNDGGLFRTNNARAATSQEECPVGPSPGPPPAVVWEGLDSGYAVTQFYHGDAGVSGTRFAAGAQDNGTSMAVSRTTPNAWTEIRGGDGGYVAIDPTNDQVIYTEIQGFPTIEKSTDGGATFFPATNGISDTDGLFITPFEMDQNDPDVVWTGGSRPWRTTDGAASWAVAGADLALPGTISAVAIAPQNGARVFLGYDNGYVAKSTNALSGSPVWTVVSSGLPLGAYLSSLAVDPSSASTVYATYSTLGVQHVYKTTNGGATWMSIDGIAATGVPDIPVHSIAVRPSNSLQLYAGTEFGVFATDDGGATWLPANTGLAHTVVEALDFIADHTLVAFTFGRGAFTTTLANAVSAPETTVPGAGGLSLAVAPVPSRGLTTVDVVLPHDGPARIAVHDVRGRLVAELWKGRIPMGRHVVTWDGRDRAGREAAAGTYFVRVEAADRAVTEKIVLVR